MSDASLEVYWGGFLLNSGTPLELTLNFCSHSCVYCFANLNRPDRTANPKQAMGLLSELWQTKGEKWKRNSYAAHLLRQGYAVTISNHVDPLASSNAFQALPIIETMVELGIPLNLQTKWGKDADCDRLLSTLDRPTPIYVSIATLNAELTRQCEAGAPLPDDRLRWTQEAIKRGHKLLVGINPVIPGWVDDPLDFAKQLKAIGVWGVVLGKLHLSRSQLKAMPSAHQAVLGEAVITEALKSRRSVPLEEAYSDLYNACVMAGLEVYTSQRGERSDIFKWMKELHPKHFPTMQDFVNHCHDTKRSGELVYWQEFKNFFVPQMPTGIWGLRDHINALVLPQVLYGKNIPQRMDYETLFWYCWQYKEIVCCPANTDCFAFAGDRLDNAGKEWLTVTDDQHLPILVFLPEGTNDYAFTDKHNL